MIIEKSDIWDNSNVTRRCFRLCYKSYSFLYLQDVSSKSVGLTREASALLSNGSPASALLGCHLSSHAELLSSKAEPPLVWFSVAIFANQRLNETLRFGMLEVQEHLETFLDRKDHATEVISLTHLDLNIPISSLALFCKIPSYSR